MMEFSVELPPELFGQELRLAGRCITDVYQGRAFTNVATYKFKYDESEKRRRIPYEDVVVPINLIIRKIISYQHEFDKLDGGMTALVVVSGDVGSFLEFWHSKKSDVGCVVRGP